MILHGGDDSAPENWLSEVAMKHVSWRHLLLLGLVSGITVLMASPAWAPHVAMLRVDPQRVEAGGEVTVWGPRGYAPESTVEIHWGAADGPLLGEFPTDTQFYAAWGPGTVTIPADAEPGQHVLFATQDIGDDEAYIRGVPARAVINVAEPDVAGVVAGAPLTERDPALFVAAPRPEGVVVEEGGMDLGVLIAVAAAVAVAAIAVGLLAARLAASRRKETGTKETVVTR